MLKHQKHISLTCDMLTRLTHLINVGQLPSECETLTQKRHHVRHHHNEHQRSQRSQRTSTITTITTNIKHRDHQRTSNIVTINEHQTS